jgi:hypothetical protein
VRSTVYLPLNNQKAQKTRHRIFCRWKRDFPVLRTERAKGHNYYGKDRKYAFWQKKKR